MYYHIFIIKTLILVLYRSNRSSTSMSSPSFSTIIVQTCPVPLSGGSPQRWSNSLAQGILSECLQLSDLPAYTTGGTVHFAPCRGWWRVMVRQEPTGAGICHTWDKSISDYGWSMVRNRWYQTTIGGAKYMGGISISDGQLPVATHRLWSWRTLIFIQAIVIGAYCTDSIHACRRNFKNQWLATSGTSVFKAENSKMRRCIGVTVINWFRIDGCDGWSIPMLQRFIIRPVLPGRKTDWRSSTWTVWGSGYQISLLLYSLHSFTHHAYRY